MTDHVDELEQAWIEMIVHHCVKDAKHAANLLGSIRRITLHRDEARRERDLLRREVCRHRAAAIQGKKPEDIAAALQWDCFKEETDDGA